jgi:hypothetical protein
MNIYGNDNNRLAVFVPTYGRRMIIDELLVVLLPLYVKYGIDLYIYDSNEDDDTMNTVELFQKRNDNLFYLRYPPEMHGNMKVMDIYQKVGWEKDYDYIWVCQDALRFTEACLVAILNNLITADYDMLVMFMDVNDGLYEREYTDLNEFFLDCMWKTTLFGACILNTRTMLEGVDWEYLTDRYCVADKINFSHACFYFEHIITLKNFKVRSIINKFNFSALRKHSGWYDSVFLVWLDYFPSAINALPDTYINKREAVRKRCLYGRGFFAVNHLIELRKDGILNRKVFKQYKRQWVMYTNTSIITFFLCTMLPLALLIFMTRNIKYTKIVIFVYHYLGLRHLKRFCKKYKDIYIYGAGMVAKRYIQYLNKMNVSISGVVVTSVKKQEQESIDGVSLMEYDEIQNKETTGIVLGLNPKNAAEVKDYLLVKQFTGGIFDEYIKKKVEKNHDDKTKGV